MRFYRFELAFDLQPQGVGFLNGLTDAIDNPRTVGRLMEDFDNHLKCPWLDEVYTRFQTMFFFTEEGLKRFAPSINAIIKALKPRGWTMLGLVLEEEDLSAAVYYDEYQVAWTRAYLEQEPKFHEVHKAEAMLNMPQNIRKRTEVLSC